MEPRNKQIWDADDVGASGRQHELGRYTRAPERSHAVKDPEHAEKPFEQELGDLASARSNAGGALIPNSHKAAIDAGEESDTSLVPKKLPNNGAQVTTEMMEGRDVAEVNAHQAPAPRTQSRTSGSMGLEGVREAARRDRRLRFTALLHHVTPQLLTQSYKALSQTAAVGVDGMTWKEYGQGLAARIERLHQAVHSGTYRVQPSRRSYIPKADGSKRPLGIAALEDKIVQQAMVTVLGAVYEQDFLGFSYGFRTGRSQHDALDALTVALQKCKVNWILDADIKAFFDNIDHEWMMTFLEHRVADRRVLRLIHKWLKAGVIEEGKRIEAQKGSPQGAVISPFLSNLYLHYVLDLWVHQWRNRHATGEVIVTRYADDVVLGFQHAGEAKRFLREMHKRFAQFALSLHPEKTRLIEFGRYAAQRRQERALGKPETFDFLGFTHCCHCTRRGDYTIRRQTIKKRMRASLAAIRAELRRRRHDAVGMQGRWLRQKVRGYFNYFAVPGNLQRLAGYRREVCRAWRQSLKRRSQRAHMAWDRFARLVDLYIPQVRQLHPYPSERFRVINQGKSRMQ